MRNLSIKSIVSISNIFLYLILILILLGFGKFSTEINSKVSFAISLVLFILSLFLFVLYHIIRNKEISKTTFQLQKKHIYFMLTFYIIQYSILTVVFLYIILSWVNVLHYDQVRIYFYAILPIAFVLTIFNSILESIVRVEEKIFIIKKQWLKNEKNKKSQLNKIEINKSINPFISDQPTTKNNKQTVKVNKNNEDKKFK